MFISKKTRTEIRKFLGFIREGELVVDPISENSKERFDFLFKNEGFLKGYIDKSRIAFYKDLIEFLQNKNIFENVNSIADFGCGTGHLLYFIKKLYPEKELFGSDFSQSAVDYAKKYIPNVNFEVIDIYDYIPNFSEKFDLIFFTEVLEHLLYPNQALENLLNMLSVNGSLIITVPDGRIDTYRGHVNFWSPESWKVFICSLANDKKYNCDFSIIENGLTNLVIINKWESNEIK